MKCKQSWCVLESRHLGRCVRLTDAINDEAAINSSAEEVMPHVRVQSADAIASGSDVVTGAAHPKTRNRRSREAYNAYMREYMKRKRAEKRSGFIGIAYG